MNKYLKNGLLLVLVAALGGALGFGVSKIIGMFQDKPKLTVTNQTINSISKQEALKKFKHDVFVPMYYKDQIVKYYIFPNDYLKVDYLKANKTLPIASVDIYSTEKTKNFKSTESFPFKYGTAFTMLTNDQTLLWFNQNKYSYVFSIKTATLPKDKEKSLAKLKEIADSFELLKS